MTDSFPPQVAGNSPLGGQQEALFILTHLGLLPSFAEAAAAIPDANE